MTAELPIEIDVQSVAKLRNEKDDFLLLDCREQDEYNQVHIAGSQLIPMGEIQDRLSELESHRNQRIVVHCHHGGRSLRVTRFLRSQGFSQVQNMSGGIDAWSLQIDPALPRY